MVFKLVKMALVMMLLVLGLMIWWSGLRNLDVTEFAVGEGSSLLVLWLSGMLPMGAITEEATQLQLY
jgi:hypothetical protein